MVRKARKITIVIETYLSGGSRIRISKLGRTYWFTRFSVEPSEPPQVSEDCSQGQAYAKFEEALKNDVLEKD